NQRIGNVAGARETVGLTTVQKFRIQRYNCKEFGHVARECQKPKRAKDATYHREKMLLCKQEEAGIQLNAEQADWRDDTDDDELEDQEFKHPEQSESVHDTYPIDQDAHNVIIDSLDMSYDREHIDQNDDDSDLANERELLASLIEKLKCEINESKNRNKFLETSNKVLNENLKGEIEDFKTKNKSLESSNNRFKEVANKLSETNNLLYTDYKKSEAELTRRNSMEYASQMEIECAKKEAQIKHYKTREDKELEIFIALENKVKVLDNIVYKTGQSVQTMNMLNNKCRTSFAKPKFLKKSQRANPRLYDIGCYNDNLTLMLTPESDEVIRLEKKSRSKLSDLIRPFDYNKLNNLYDLFVPQREKSSEQRYFSERSRLSHTSVNNGNSKESFNKQTTLLEKRMDESIPLDKKCLNEEMVADLRYYNSLELEVDSLGSQLETQKTQFLNEIDRLSREYYYADYMNAILGVYTELDEVTNLQCDYLELLEKCECLKTELLKRVISTTSVSRPQLKSNPMGDRVMRNNSQGKKQEVEDPRRSVKFCKNKTSVTACNDSLNAKTLNLIEIVLFIIDSGCSKHITGNLKLLINFMEKFLRTVKFGNDQIAPILGYRDLVQGAIMIKRIYYVERLNHKLFSVGQFCDADLEVAFRKSTCYIRDLKGNDLLTDHLCSSCELGKAKRKSFHTKLTPSLKRRLQLLHMDLCGPMRVASINGKIYVLVIVDDYSKYTWTHFLRSKDETPKVIINFLRLVQRRLQAQVRIVRTDKGTEFLNQTLHAYFAAEGILHQTFVARTPEQNGVVERRNRTLVEAARTMLSTAKVPLFFWAEAIATTDGENLDKMKEKVNECIFVGYSTQSRAYRVFNKKTKVIMESIHVNFDELPHMASDHISSDPAPECQRMALEHDSLSPAIQRQANVPQADRTVITPNELDLLFSPMFDELLNGSSKIVSKSSAVSSADAPNQRQQHTIPLNNHTTPAPTCQAPTLAPTVTSSENINQAETYVENDQVADDEFINIFCTPIQDRGETSSRHVVSSNMHTFYQRYPSEHHWTKDHPLEQVIGNPSQSVRTRRQLESDVKMYMFALTVSRTEPKNIKEAMADSGWIESMQEELYQFDRLDIWELVDRPLCTNVINLKWLWKNKRDEKNTVIQNKSRLVAKGYAQKEGVDF
nr:hypothetical protein [Tanacetum cinerariifolium]